jgi:hypothetical protein
MTTAPNQLVWVLYDGVHWPAWTLTEDDAERLMGIKPEAPQVAVLFYGGGGGCAVEPSTIEPFSFDDPERVNNPVIAVAIAEVRQQQERVGSSNAAPEDFNPDAADAAAAAAEAEAAEKAAADALLLALNDEEEAADEAEAAAAAKAAAKEAKRAAKEQDRLAKLEDKRLKQEAKERAKAEKKKRLAETESEEEAEDEDEASDSDAGSVDKDDGAEVAVERLRGPGGGAGGRVSNFGRRADGVRNVPALERLTPGAAGGLVEALRDAQEYYEVQRNAAVAADRVMPMWDEDLLLAARAEYDQRMLLQQFLLQEASSGDNGTSGDVQPGAAVTELKKMAKDLDKRFSVRAPLPPRPAAPEGAAEGAEPPAPEPPLMSVARTLERPIRRRGTPAFRYVDPLMRRVEAPRIDVDVVPLRRRLEEKVTGGDADRVVIMREWRALRDLTQPTPQDVQRVPATGALARQFNEPRAKVQRAVVERSAKLLRTDAATIEATLQLRPNNAQARLINYADAAEVQREMQTQFLAPPPLESVAPTPNYTAGEDFAVPSTVASAAYSGVGAVSAIHLSASALHTPAYLRHTGTLGAAMGVGAGGSTRESIRAESLDISTRASTARSQESGAQAHRPTWKASAARVISRVLTPFLARAHGGSTAVKASIGSQDEFVMLAKKLTDRAFGEKLKAVGLAPELRNVDIGPFSEEDAISVAHAVQFYMRRRDKERTPSQVSSSEYSRSMSSAESLTGTSLSSGSRDRSMTSMSTASSSASMGREGSNRSLDNI